MGGLVGTFEGYVASANDLYNRGSNPLGFSGKYCWLESGQMRIEDYSSLQIGDGLGALAALSNNFDLTGYRNLHMYFYVVSSSSGSKGKISLSSSTNGLESTVDGSSSIVTSSVVNSYQTLNVGVGAINGVRRIGIHVQGSRCYVYQVWVD